MNPSLLLCGASVRAAAWSARRAGFRDVQAIDLFADADLALNCPVAQVSPVKYPAGLGALAREFFADAVLYTGALENHARVVADLGRDRVLWGNTAETLRAVRDPFLLAQALEEAGLPHPRVPRDLPPASDAWLVKRKQGGAGFGIQAWQGEPLEREQYLQEFISGPAHAAIYCGFPDGRSLLLGVTRQLVGLDWVHSRPFHYCGSLGAVDIGAAGTTTLERLGGVLVGRFGLRGLFGVDFILHQARPYPVEVNPRYTASVEILERSLGLRSLAHHRAAFDSSFEAPVVKEQGRECWGKVILFAPQDFSFPDDGPWRASLVSWDETPEAEFADIPRPGTLIARGHPVFTLFARGDSPDDCVATLRRKVRDTEGWLYP